jgi:hypothetical protein
MKEDVFVKFSDKFYNKIKILHQKDSLKDKIIQFSKIRQNENNKKFLRKYFKILDPNETINTGGVTAKERIIEFYISQQNGCNVLINDTVIYEQNANENINLVEHSILQNNIDSIDPNYVSSDQMDINYFAYDKQQNIFSVYFEKSHNKTNSSKKIFIKLQLFDD